MNIRKENYSNDTLTKIKLFENCNDTKNKWNTKKIHATLLIPKHLLLHLKKISSTSKKSLIVQNLLQKYKELLLSDEKLFANKLNTLYQETGLELEKVSFPVEEEIWAELKQLRILLNWSICKIMSFIIYLDSTEFIKNLPEKLLEIVVPSSKKFLQIGKTFLSTKCPKFIRRLYIKRFDRYL